MPHINTWVYMDLESTGLEKERPRVTELSLVAVEPRNIGKNPRVLNKLTLCFNPEGARFSKWVMNHTGLNPDNLSSQPRFSENTVRLLDAFLGSLPGPVCLVYVCILDISIIYTSNISKNLWQNTMYVHNNLHMYTSVYGCMHM